MSDFSNEEIEETYLASQSEQIANLNQVIINLRAQLVLQAKKLKDLDKKKEGLDSALERISGVDKVIVQLQKEVAYYEDNLELVWKRRIRPAKLIKDKANIVEQDKMPRRIISPVNDLMNIKRNFEQDTDRFETKINRLQEENTKLKEDLKILRVDNENMPIPQSLQIEWAQKIEVYEKKLEKAEQDKTFYMNLCYGSKDVDDSIIINKETKDSPRKGLGEVLKAK
jgi:hypothetical protein